MIYYDLFLQYQRFSSEELFQKITEQDVVRAIESERADAGQLRALLSPAAEPFLEPMAQKANRLTVAHWGRTMQLYTPMYLSNYCENQCAYCGFNAGNPVNRRRLTLEEVEREAGFIAGTGIKHILILTGDSREQSPLSYLKDCLRILKKYFSSISVEIYALTAEEYDEVIKEGVDGLTIYQETYEETVYDRVHRLGPKKDFRFRLDAPERAARSGMRSVNLGVLLGLSDWRRDAFFLGLHAQYLQDKFGELEVGISVPRLRPHTGDFKAACLVEDKSLAQIMVALRIFLPRLGITLSTRENAKLRENLLPLGVTRMSAGSTTKVGGHTAGEYGEEETSQFEISDQRNVAATREMLVSKGYQPVMKDWMQL